MNKPVLHILKKLKTPLSGSLVVAIVLTTIAPLLMFPDKIFALNLTEASLRLDRMTPSVTDNDILVIIKPASTVVEDEIQITFDAAFTVDGTNTNITTLATTGVISTYQGESITTLPSLGATASSVTGQVVEIASGDLTPGTLYGFFITAGIDNPGAAGTHETTIATLTSNVVQDSAKVATRIIANDQVVFTATVPPTFSFALGANVTQIDNAPDDDLDVAEINFADGVTVSISTNADSGWIAWLKSANAGLDSLATGETIDTQDVATDDTCTQLVAGADYYQLDVNLTSDNGTGTGTVTIDTEYDCADLDEGGTFSTTYEEIAISDGSTAGDVITLVAKVTYIAIKQAGTDYTDTWTVIGAANF
jgi:hypothetical protein